MTGSIQKWQKGRKIEKILRFFSVLSKSVRIQPTHLLFAQRLKAWWEVLHNFLGVKKTTRFYFTVVGASFFSVHNSTTIGSQHISKAHFLLFRSLSCPLRTSNNGGRYDRSWKYLRSINIVPESLFLYLLVLNTRWNVAHTSYYSTCSEPRSSPLSCFQPVFPPPAPMCLPHVWKESRVSSVCVYVWFWASSLSKRRRRRPRAFAAAVAAAPRPPTSASSPPVPPLPRPPPARPTPVAWPPWRWPPRSSWRSRWCLRSPSPTSAQTSLSLQGRLLPWRVLTREQGWTSKIIE